MAHTASLPVGLVVACLCAAPATADTIYQCTGNDGKQVLQNMPCESGTEVRLPDTVDAKGASPAPDSAQPATGAMPAPDATSSASAAQVRNASGGAAATGDLAASDDSANLPSDPELGMTQQQVRAILGPPTAVTQEEVVQGRETVWSYGDRVLQFDTAGRLTKK